MWAFISWNDQAFYDQFYDGLQENVKDGLANVEIWATTLEELIQKAQKIDNCITECISEKKSTHKTASLSLNRKPLIFFSNQLWPVVTVSAPWWLAPTALRIQPPTPNQLQVPTFTADGMTLMELDVGYQEDFQLKLTPE